MEIWPLWLILFVLNIIDDILAVLYVRRTAAGKAVQAALISGLLTGIIAFSVVNYVESKWNLVPIIAGSILGCFVAVKWDKAYRRKKYGRKKKAEEKKCLSIVTAAPVVETCKNHTENSVIG